MSALARAFRLCLNAPCARMRWDDAGDAADVMVTASSLQAAPIARRHIFAAVIGNALEFYDFITYSFFAIQIGHAFFPAQNAFASLMLSLATFGAGFLTRPIGGIVIGAYADRAGRKAAMLLSFSLMGVAIIAMALIPPYAAIGLAAPLLAVSARLVQGFALGGEVGPNIAYLLEAASPRRRGLVGSWQTASQMISSLSGSLVGLALAATLSHAALDEYGWRIAFLLGGVTLPFGLMLRHSMPETLTMPDRLDASETPVRDSGARGFGAVRENARIILVGLTVLAGGTVATYITNYLTTYAQATLKMAAGIAFAATVTQAVFGFAGSLLGGEWSDRFGRRPVLFWSTMATVLALYPVFHWMAAARSAPALLGGAAVLGFLASMTNGAFYAALGEGLPKRLRGRGIAIIYASAITIFGGTTQPIITWLIHVTGDPMAPGWYELAFKLATLVAVMAMVETAPVKMTPSGLRGA
jgi:MHS family citrate/tricarballylate:H+ symporter-like MFS transporter